MKYAILFLALMLISGCSLFFEDDLSKVKVDMLSPPNGYTTYTQTQTFVWDTLPSATKYRFQLVSKRFDFIEDYVLDTVLTTRSITLGLAPKEYQWRVTGYNNSSETDYYTYNLTVVQDTSLANQIVNVIAPVANDVYAQDSVAFWWTALGLANQYQVQISTHPSFNSQTIVKDSTTAQDYLYIINQLGIGTFYWRMRAMRVGIDTTNFTTVKSFNINRIPLHVAPANNSTQTLPLNISWTTASNVAKDSLFLYFNSTATPYKSLELLNNNYTFNGLDTTGYGAGTYYWQLKSVATNGYMSSTSNLWQFTIN